MGGEDLLSCLRTLGPVLERHAQTRFGGAAATAGWQDFSRWGTAAIAHEREIYQPAFTAWWLFAWVPDDQGLNDERFLAPAPDHAIAADYLALHRANLSPLDQRVIERALASPYSFYTIVSIEPDNRLRLQEIYTEKQCMIEGDVSVSYTVGEVLFCAVLSVDRVSILLGFMPQALGANSLAQIEAHRKKWRLELGKAIDKRELYLHDTELAALLFPIVESEAASKPALRV